MATIDFILRSKVLTRDQLAIPCPDSHCNELARKLDRWELLAPYIGLSDAECTAIKANNAIPGYESQRRALLSKWKEIYVGEATYLKLALGLEKIGRLDLVEALCTIYKSADPVPDHDNAVTVKGDSPIITKDKEAEMIKEIPIITEDEEAEKIKESRPHSNPRDKLQREKLDVFCQNVKLIIQTANDNEYYAGTTFMKAPDIEGNNYSNGVIFPGPCSVVGMFAGKKTALILSDQGRECVKDIDDAIKNFPNVKYIFGVGVCYGFKEMHKLGDVLVSKRIHELVNLKFENGEILDRNGTIVKVENQLQRAFCNDLKSIEGLEVSDGRQSEVHVGTILSYTSLINWKQLREKLNNLSKHAIGGEMEGGELWRFIGKGKIEGVIIIKGVADYGDGNKKKEWQFTAARAAFNYTELKYAEVYTGSSED